MSQDRQKTYADKSRRPSPNYKVNDLSPVVPLKKRGRPRKQPLVPRGTAGECHNVAAHPRRDGLRRCRENVTTTFKPCLPLMISGSQGHHLFFREAETRSPLFGSGSLPGKRCTRGVRESLFPPLVLKPFSVTIMDVCCFVVFI
ncbi:hypothetical protein TNCV_1780211 [Trichonephila clavipes]|nr:hypothetical protein TNCV_1780211 [Trichonephila clavipes]